MPANTHVIHIGGYEISATFTETKNESVNSHIK